MAAETLPGIALPVDILARHIRGRWRWVGDEKSWLRFGGSAWEPQEPEQLFGELKDAVRGWVGRQDDDQAAYKRAAAMLSPAFVAATLKHVRGARGIVSKGDDFDRPGQGTEKEPWLFHCANKVTIELFEGGRWRTRKTRPGDLNTRVGAAYDPKAECPEFDRRLPEYQPDPEVRGYILRCYAAALRGVQAEQFVINHGPGGGNGKGTVQAGIESAFGKVGTQPGYAGIFPVDLLLTRCRSSNEYRSEISRVRTARVVFVDEPDEGARLDVARINQLTGGSTVSIREMHAKATSFKPSYTLLLACNELPSWGANGGLNRRLDIVPWLFQAPAIAGGGKGDASIKARIEQEGSGILNRILAAYEQWGRKGLSAPRTVVEATQAGKDQADGVSRFLAARYSRYEGNRIHTHWILKDVVWATYQQWAADERETHPVTRSQLGRRLKARGIAEGGPQNTRWLGLAPKGS